MKQFIRTNSRFNQLGFIKAWKAKFFYTFICACLMVALIGPIVPAYAAGVIYVDDDSTCTSSCGGSWTSAYPNLQSALAVASSGDEIWVAEGVYYPDEGTGQTDNDIHSIFTLVNGVSIYGGFVGDETMLSQRDATENRTILSGDIDKNDINTDGNNIAETYADIQGVNALHVTLGSFTDSTTVLDGFTITAGYAPGGYASSTVAWVDSGNGGGMLIINGSPMLFHLIFSGNVAYVNGGGLFSGLDASYPGTSNPTLTDIAFNGNYAVYGGGMFNLSSSPSLANFTFSNNTAGWGGGLYNKWGDPALVNLTLSENNASNQGGGMFVETGNPTLTNVSFSGNTASTEGGGMYNYNSHPTLINTMLANSTSGGDCVNNLNSSLSASSSNNLIEDSVNSCGLANGINGNIIGSDPNLEPLANNDGFTRTLALASGSPAIDAGTNTGCPATDQRGLARPQGTACDIGAFEFVNPVPGISSLNPTSAQAGAADISISIYGTNLTTDTVIQWLDSTTDTTTDLTTTFVSSSELAAWVPSALLVIGGTFEVSAFNPPPGGGPSSPLIFFVTESGATVTSTDSATSTDPAGTATASTGGTGPMTPGSVTATATGKGTIAVATYSKNPVSKVPKGKVIKHFDVRKSKESSILKVKAVMCESTLSTVQWFDGASWKIAKAQSRSGGCNTVELNDTSSPTLAQLTGTVFALVNLPPVAEASGPYLSAINTDVQFNGSGSSDPEDDTLSYTWDFGDSTTGTGEMPTHSYSTSGIYNVCLTVADEWQDSDPNCTMAVVYDPDNGFVTGGGWFDSPAGAYAADPSLTGKATFGFVSKYKKGASVPSGNTEFQFKAGGFNFHSDTYEWLVVNQNGANAQFKGSGTINGAPDSNGNAYKFMLWAGEGSPDTFRIKIWYENEAGEHIVYDNVLDQDIGGGSIVVHSK